MGCQKNKYGQVLNLQGYKQISTNKEARWTKLTIVTPRYSPKATFQVFSWQVPYKEIQLDNMYNLAALDLRDRSQI